MGSGSLPADAVGAAGPISVTAVLLSRAVVSTPVVVFSSSVMVFLTSFVDLSTTVGFFSSSVTIFFTSFVVSSTSVLVRERVRETHKIRVIVRLKDTKLLAKLRYSSFLKTTPH